jgi:hypothetical protein
MTNCLCSVVSNRCGMSSVGAPHHTGTGKARLQAQDVPQLTRLQRAGKSLEALPITICFTKITTLSSRSCFRPWTNVTHSRYYHRRYFEAQYCAASCALPLCRLCEVALPGSCDSPILPAAHIVRWERVFRPELMVNARARTMDLSLLRNFSLTRKGFSNLHS